jgi:hypothetical protein
MPAFPQLPVSVSADNSPPAPDTITPVAYNFTIDRKGKKTQRPGTAESGQQLLPKLGGDDDGDNDPRGSTEVYNSYRESLNSLGDIVARVCSCRVLCPQTYRRFPGRQGFARAAPRNHAWRPR